MQRRVFIATAATAVAVAPFITPAGAVASRPGPVLLTVSGAIANGNRGPRNALDQLMHSTASSSSVLRPSTTPRWRPCRR